MGTGLRRRSTRSCSRCCPTARSAASALEAEQIELAAFSAVPLADLDRISRVPGLKVYTNGYEGLTYQLVVEINHRRKELADVRVRRALAHAHRPRLRGEDDLPRLCQGRLDRPGAAIRQDLLRPRRARYPFDPARAEALLDEAGYKRGADGIRFRLKLLPAPFFNETKQFGDYLRQALRQGRHRCADRLERHAGASEGGLYRPRLRHRRGDAGLPPATRRSRPPSWLQSGLPAGVPFSNQYGYADPEVDGLIRDAASTIDDDERAELYKALQTEGGAGPAADQRRRVQLHHRGARHRRRTCRTIRAGRCRTGAACLGEAIADRLQAHARLFPWPRTEGAPHLPLLPKGTFPAEREKASTAVSPLLMTGMAIPRVLAVVLGRIAGAVPVLAIVPSASSFCCWRRRRGRGRRLSRRGGRGDAQRIAELRAAWASTVGRCSAWPPMPGALAEGDLGWSSAFERPVRDVVLERLPVTRSP